MRFYGKARGRPGPAQNIDRFPALEGNPTGTFWADDMGHPSSRPGGDGERITVDLATARLRQWEVQHRRR